MKTLITLMLLPLVGIAATPASADRRSYEHVHKDAQGRVVRAPGHDNGAHKGGMDKFIDADGFADAIRQGQQSAADVARLQRELRAADQAYAFAERGARFYTAKTIHAHVEYVASNVVKIIEGHDTGTLLMTEGCAFAGHSREATLLGSKVVFGEKPEQTITCNILKVFPPGK